MINSGNNILRFVKMATARQGSHLLENGQMYLYKFTADSLKGEHLDFIFQVSPFGELPQIIQDLIRLTKTKEWTECLLHETANRMLMIKSIKYIANQEEMNERSRIERITVQ